MGSYGVSTLPPASITCIILSSGVRQHLIAYLCDINSLLQCLLTLGIHPSPPASGLFHSALVLLVSLLLLKARSCLRALALAVLSAWTFLFSDISKPCCSLHSSLGSNVTFSVTSTLTTLLKIAHAHAPVAPSLLKIFLTP